MSRKEKIKDILGKIFFGALTLVGLWGTVWIWTRKKYTDPSPIGITEPEYIVLKGGDE